MKHNLPEVSKEKKDEEQNIQIQTACIVLHARKIIHSHGHDIIILQVVIGGGIEKKKILIYKMSNTEPKQLLSSVDIKGITNENEFR